MRLRIVLACFAGLAALAASLVARPAAAKSCSGLYSPCIDDDTLWPHAGPARFAAVGSTDTVAPGQVGFGLVTTYLNDPIVLRTFVGPPGTTAASADQNVVKDQVNGSFLWSYGVTSRLQLDLTLPVTFGQSGGGLAAVTGGDGLKDTAIRDLRFGFAYVLLAHPRVADAAMPTGFGLAGRLEMSAPSGDAEQFAGERSAVFVPSLAADWRAGRFIVGAEVGARLRPTTESVGARVGSQLVTALGVGYDLLARRELLTATLEAWALPTFAEQHDLVSSNGSTLSVPDGKSIAPAEWQLSVRTAPVHDGDLSIQAGGGTELPFTGNVITQPHFRFTLGIRWAPGGRAATGKP
ncbi:MAG: hypothetical protein ACRELB_04045 [Polyangiaceae bacterium]